MRAPDVQEPFAWEHEFVTRQRHEGVALP